MHAESEVSLLKIKYKVLAEDFATFYALQSVGPDQYKVKTMRIYIDTAALGAALAELQKPS